MMSWLHVSWMKHVPAITLTPFFQPDRLVGEYEGKAEFGLVAGCSRSVAGTCDCIPQRRGATTICVTFIKLKVVFSIK